MKRFWNWYDRNLERNTAIAAGLFVWQIAHLWWLTAHVVAMRLFGVSFFDPGSVWEYLIIIVDYTEIPAIILTSFLYVNILRRGFSMKEAALLAMLNSQWIHLFWITDEFVLRGFAGEAGFPVWIAWTAIGIDYLELPVIFDTLRRALRGLARTV